MASDEAVARVLSEHRSIALPIYLAAVIASIVVSPFGGPISIMAVGVQVLGFSWAFPAYLVGRSIGTAAAYWIGLRHGERIVRALTGRRGLELVRRLTAVVNDATLISLRVFDGNLSDYVSYAAGLRRVPAVSYLWKTNLLPLPFLASVGIVLRETRGDIGSLTAAIVAATILSVVATAIVYRAFDVADPPATRVVRIGDAPPRDRVLRTIRS
jgi:uncharacterized membrane protein YdjX (TVP38/TMEM64 family)